MNASSGALSPLSSKLFFSGDDFFRNLIKDIDRAESEVFIETYIFNLDPIGIQILDALTRAKHRGVRVRILVDAVGSFHWIPLLQRECHKRSLPFQIYHPLPFQVDIWQNFSWKNLLRILSLFKRINKRNHRKITYIDHAIIYTGSRNITQVHSERFLAAKAWRDTCVRMEFQSPLPLKEVYRSFQKIWKRSRFPLLTSKRLFKRVPWAPKKFHSSILRLNSKSVWRMHLLRDFIRRMNGAKERVFVTNAYFLPRLLVLRSLRKAAKRGVQVSLCLPALNDVWFLQMASRSLYYRLLKSGVRIYEYYGKVLHAKTLIIDDWATVGSHNLNHRSFVHDLEIEAVIENPTLVENLVNQWNSDIQQSKEITFQTLQGLSLMERIFGRIFYWFRYWL